MKNDEVWTKERLAIAEKLASAGVSVYWENGWQFTQVLYPQGQGLGRMVVRDGITLSKDGTSLAISAPPPDYHSLLSMFKLAQQNGTGFYFDDSRLVSGSSRSVPTFSDFAINSCPRLEHKRLVNESVERCVVTARESLGSVSWNESQSRLACEQIIGGVSENKRTIFNFTEASPWTVDEISKLAYQVEEKPQRGKYPTGKYEVFFRGAAAAIVAHEILGHYLEGDVGANLPNEESRLGPSGLRVVDACTTMDPWSSALSDDTGLPLQDVPLVDDGHVINLIGKSHKDSPQWRRESFSDPVIPRMRHLVVSGQDHIVPSGKTLVVDTLKSGRLNSRTLVCSLEFGEVSLDGKPVSGGMVRMPVSELLRCLIAVGGKAESSREMCTKARQRLRTSTTSAPMLFSRLEVK